MHYDTAPYILFPLLALHPSVPAVPFAALFSTFKFDFVGADSAHCSEVRVQMALAAVRAMTQR